MTEETLKVSWWFWSLLGLLLLMQSTGLFLHAKRRGGKAWLWGLWGLTQFPSPTLTYMLLQWWKKRKRRLKAIEIDKK
ncbi:sigmaY antisigma factor component [Cohnella sp. WQ 127256]|uniref:sigmaY antisigma factor component n=1 Tax=Cohnella sp. WQ 127256 TaxID=2938790 RepID=UPI002118015C|nr:sigmaY antisigma factor component [Cohnella sp. WQ 127256]